jgi:hypothetical protein
MPNTTHRVFDAGTHPDLTNVHDRFPQKPSVDRVYFGEGDIAQGADLNEAFSIEEDRRAAIGDLIARDGDRIDGADVVVDIDAQTVTITAGKIYVRGAPRSVAAAVLSSVPMTGDIEIGVRITKTPVTAADDAEYLGLEPGTIAFEEPGGVRTQYSIAWGWIGNGGTGEFYRYLLLRDGQIVSQDAPPTLSGVVQQIKEYDSEAHGNYIARGCEVSPLGLDAGKQWFAIEGGSANILGLKVRRPGATRFSVTEAPDLGTVDAEPHSFDNGGSGAATITVRRGPISAVTSAIVTKERTVTIIKGTSGSTDALPDDGVTELLLVEQGATEYVVTTDYVQSGDGVSWAPGGDEPTTGSSYDVTYRYLDAVTPDAVTATTIVLSGGVTGETVLVGYKYKLPRVDRICLDSNGNVIYLTGISAPNQPHPPAEPATLLSLATVYNDWFGTPRVDNDGVRSYPYKTIDKMFHKLLDLLDETGLDRLKRDASSRAPGAANGIFADAFIDDSKRDAGEAQTAAVFGESLQIAIDPTFQEITASATLALDFQETGVILQEQVSGCEKINPYQVFTPPPARMSITPSVDFWTQTVTQWLSDQTSVFGIGNSERVVSSTIQTNAQVQALRFLREITVAFRIEEFGNGETLDELYFDGIDVTPAGLSANASGVITGSFAIPANVTAGTKEVVAVGGSGTRCSARFVGQGRIETTVLQRVTTVERFTVQPPARDFFAGWGSNANSSAGAESADPQAQSFVLPASQHISSIDLRFCAIGDRDNPVIVELVTVENGFPTTTVIAQTEIDMNTVLANTWTKFSFGVPVFLPAGEMFAFVVKTDDADHSISIATRGRFDAAAQRWIAAQPYTVGTRFSSSNAVSWTVHQDSDVTFRLNCARFNPTSKTVDLGTYAVTNCSDIIVRGDVLLPTDAARVEFEIVFGDEAPIRILPDQVWERSSFFTGDVTIRAILTGTATISPIVGRSILAIFGTMRASGTYVTNAFAMGADVRLDAIMSTKLPVGSSLTVEADAGDDSWQAVALSTSSPIDGGFIERTYSRPSHAAADGGRLRLTLTGTPAARPSVADLRAFSI